MCDVRKTYPQRTGLVDPLATAAARGRYYRKGDAADRAIAGEDFTVCRRARKQFSGPCYSGNH